MVLLLDNFDSFTYNLLDYLKRLGVPCLVLRNDTPMRTITRNDYSAIVLSPGPERPETAGCLMEVIGHYHQQLPILGVCLGHQALGLWFGAELVHAAKPMHGKLSDIQCMPVMPFDALPQQMTVVRYHSLLLTQLPTHLQAIAWTDQGEVMAMRHQQLPIIGLQFHPEAWLTRYGQQILGNWARHYGLTR